MAIRYSLSQNGNDHVHLAVCNSPRIINMPAGRWRATRPRTFVTSAAGPRNVWTGDAMDDGEPAPDMWTDVQLPVPSVDAYERGAASGKAGPDDYMTHR